MIRCPACGHVIEINTVISNRDLFCCDRCGPDEFVRVVLTMEHHTGWRYASPITEKGSD